MINVLFTLASALLPFWLLMLILPGWRLTQWFAERAIFPLLLGVIYVLGFATVIFNNGLGFVADFGSAEGVVGLMSDANFALIAWIHILCFDMAVGHYIFKDNMKHRYIPLWLQSLLLFFTLMAGPLGLITYMGLRRLSKRKRN